MEITAPAVQSVEVNQNVLFTNTVVSGNCSICHREGSGIVKLRGITNSQCRARFKVTFNGNIGVPTGGTAAATQLAIAVDGEGVGSGTMIVTPAAVNEYFNVSSTIFVDVLRGCCSVISINNNGNDVVSVQNANLIIERVA